MQIIFSIWGLIGLFINGIVFLTLTGNVGVGTSAYLTVGNLIWIGGMVLFGFGAMFPSTKKAPWAGLFPSKRQLIQTQIEKDRLEGIFRPDGMVGNTPYRLLPFTGEAEALMQGGTVRFPSVEHLRSMLSPASQHTFTASDKPAPDLTALPDKTAMQRSTNDKPAPAPLDPVPHENVTPAPINLANEKSGPSAPPNETMAPAPAPIKRKGNAVAWTIIVGAIVFIVVFLILSARG